MVQVSTLQMLSATFIQSKDANIFKPCHVGIHWIALTEYSQMSTHLPGFQSFSGFLIYFVLAKLASSGIRVNNLWCNFPPSYGGMCWSRVDGTSVEFSGGALQEIGPSVRISDPIQHETQWKPIVENNCSF